MTAVRAARRLADLADVTGEPSVTTSPVYDGTEYPLTEVVPLTALTAILDGVRAVNWRPLPLQRPRFSPFGQGFTDPAYRLTLNNVVHIQGMVACNPPLSEDDVGVLVAVLDEDSRPLGRLLYGCSAYGNNARFDIEADGRITFEGMLIGGGMIDWFTLSVIHFSVGAAQ